MTLPHRNRNFLYALILSCSLLTGCSAPRLKNPQPQVVAFVAPWCPHCKHLEQFLDTHQVMYQRMDIAAQPRAKRLLDGLGRSTVPTVMVNQTIVDGFNKKALEKLLFE